MSGNTTVVTSDRDLDVQIAEKVMGWRRSGKHQHKHSMTPPDEDDVVTRAVDFYSSDMAHAWRVVDALASKGFYVCVEHVSKSRNSWNAWVGDKNVAADTAPLAICRAALLVVGAS